jgi:hypothetical protein
VLNIYGSKAEKVLNEHYRKKWNAQVVLSPLSGKYYSFKDNKTKIIVWCEILGPQGGEYEV